MSSEQVDPFILQQLEWKHHVVCEDIKNWQKFRSIASNNENTIDDVVKYVAGLDISYLKCDPDTGCVALVVCRLPGLEVVYKGCDVIHSESKYVAGCLAAREAPFLVEAYKKLKRTHPEFLPQLNKDENHKKKIKSLSKKGDSFPLIGQSGRVFGLALRTGQQAVNPVYVSVGHQISLETASWLVDVCSIHRIPEPIRQADYISGEFLKKTFPDKE
ncbi:hypothetical protein CHUAL_011516 [Chamberlinius hualienensis]